MGTLMVVPGAITVVMMLVVSYPTDPSVPLSGSLDRGDRRLNGTDVDICDWYFKAVDGSWYGALMIFAVICVSNVVAAVLKSNDGSDVDVDEEDPSNCISGSVARLII